MTKTIIPPLTSPRSPIVPIDDLLKDIRERREEIKEQFIKAWLATTVADVNLNAEWIMEHIELVERWSSDRLSVSWSLRVKEKIS